MDLGEYLKISLTSFLIRLDATNITFRVKYGYNRCMARGGMLKNGISIKDVKDNQ